jgi:putative Ca2+/H+ antiporter (TMEM165/GDT1 family)
VNLAATISSFLVVLPAELPDKTVLACLVMGSRYRPGYVFAGAGAAFAVHVVLAVVAGSLLGLLPRRPIEAVVGVLFIGGAVILWRQQHRDSDEYAVEQEPRDRFLPVASMAFAVVFAAEFGDLTQIVTASLAVKYHDPVSVGTGAVLALWLAAALAIIGGRSLLKVVPMMWLTRGAALLMLALAGTSIAAAVS